MSTHDYVPQASKYEIQGNEHTHAEVIVGIMNRCNNDVLRSCLLHIWFDHIYIYIYILSLHGLAMVCFLLYFVLFCLHHHMPKAFTNVVALCVLASRCFDHR